jgi:hypothetical protein
MRICSLLIVLAATLTAVGCGPAKSGDGKANGKKSTAKPTAASQPGKTTDPAPDVKKPATPRKTPVHRKLLMDLLHEKIPNSPSRKDGLEALPGWKVADWEDAATYKRFREKKTGLVMIYLGTGGGSKGKCAVTYTKDLCLAPKGELKLVVYNYGDNPVGLAVAFRCSGGWVYYESKMRKLPTHAWTKLAFNLATADFKTASSKWKHNASLWKREDTKQISILVYHSGKPAQLLIDGVTVDQAPRPKAKPKPKAKAKPEKRATKSGPPSEKAPIKGDRKVKKEKAEKKTR